MRRRFPTERGSAHTVIVRRRAIEQDDPSFRRARPHHITDESVQTDSAADLENDASHAGRSGWLLAACVLAVLLVCSGTASAEPESAPAIPPYFDRRDADVYLVPVGACSKEYLVMLADYYEHDLGIRMGIAPALTYRDGLYNPQRKQLATEPVIAWMMTKFEDYSTNADAVFIGVTHNDIYIATSSRPFAFEQRVPPHYAFISSNRTSQRPVGETARITEVQPSLRKLVTRTIGALHFGKPESTNPRNVMYGPLRSLDDLESIDESTARSLLIE